MSLLHRAKSCLVLTLSASSLLAGAPADAKEKVCRVYEFAELNTFSSGELEGMKAEYTGIRDRIANGMNDPATAPMNAEKLREDMGDQKNCDEESRRIGRILTSREATASSPSTQKKPGGSHPQLNRENEPAGLVS